MRTARASARRFPTCQKGEFDEPRQPLNRDDEKSKRVRARGGAGQGLLVAVLDLDQVRFALRSGGPARPPSLRRSCHGAAGTAALQAPRCGARGAENACSSSRWGVSLGNTIGILIQARSARCCQRHAARGARDAPPRQKSASWGISRNRRLELGTCGPGQLLHPKHNGAHFPLAWHNAYAALSRPRGGWARAGARRLRRRRVGSAGAGRGACRGIACTEAPCPWPGKWRLTGGSRPEESKARLMMAVRTREDDTWGFGGGDEATLG